MKNNTLELKGYSIEKVPNLQVRPWSHYKHKDGRVVRLPSDPRSLKYYTSKGLVVVTDEINDIFPLVKAEEVVEEVPKPARKPRKARKKSKKGGEA